MRDKYLFVPLPNVPQSHEIDRDQIAAMFNHDKAARKQRSNQAEQGLRNRLALAPVDAHPDLHQYEQDILNGGGDWARIKRILQLRLTGVLQIVENGGLVDFYVLREGSNHRVGSAYRGDERFVALAVQPGDAGGTTVYKRRGDNKNRHYIRLPQTGSYVRRFVTRGLNYTDAMNLSLGRDLTSVIDHQTAPLATNRVNAQVVEAQGNERGLRKHGVGANANLTENQQIISHTRGWTKRYVSTGVSNRPAFSTRGTVFQSIYGAVVVDLAHVPSVQIFDIHRYDQASGALGRPATDVLNNNHHTGSNDLAEQQYLALRDVIRTRELLIKGSVPIAAVRMQSRGRCLVGIGSPGNAQGAHSRSAQKIAGLPNQFRSQMVVEENLGFKDWHTGLRWHLVQFRTPAAAVMARSWLENVKEQGQILVAFNQYQPARPVAGMV